MAGLAPEPRHFRQTLLLWLGGLVLSGACAWWQAHPHLTLAEAVPRGVAQIAVTPDEDGVPWAEPIVEYKPVAPGKVVLAVASYEELLACPGIGPRLARRLLAARRERPFTDWADLRQRVPGCGPALIAELRKAGVRLDTAGPAPAGHGDGEGRR